MRSDGGDAEEKCPVDHRTREAWLQAAKANKNKPTPPSTPSTSTTPPPPPAARFSLDTFTWQSSEAPPNARKLRPLPTDREISSIPRAVVSDPSTLNSAEKAALPTPPRNNEVETGHDSSSGNWIYPSQSQFFDAMKRKGHVANPQDMSSIVPIHNAVNERAWTQILEWEKGWGAERCGGPKLLSFAGDSKKKTPKAYWNMWVMGYSAPFDRHDWVVERCGKKVEYVIDFYKGRDAEGMGVPLSFFLDVRPKVNSWEGVKMRIARTFGF